jgi:hypothetical protein
LTNKIHNMQDQVGFLLVCKQQNMPFLEQNPHARTSVLCSAADVIISTGLLVMAFFALFTRFSAHCASLFLGVNTKAS